MRLGGKISRVTLVRDWPLFGLRLETPRLMLSYPTDADFEALNAVVDRGIHDPELMPFAIPWTDDPPDVRPRNSLQFWWGLRAGWKPAQWHLPLVVREGGEVVGVQSLHGTDFAVTRQVETGSWLGRSYQGQGIGKEMRAAVLELAFAGLGAERATSGAWEDNPASLRVSRALGYVENGDDIMARRGRPARHIRLLLHRQVWEQHRRRDIGIHGLEPCLPMFGVA
jgi:RimJ/RimL family protein N-acetyltransferase